MSDQLIDVRTPLAVSENVRVEAGSDGVLHVHVGPLTIHLDRDRCEELTTTLARAMVGLARAERRSRSPRLRLVRAENEEIET
jgi:hypothetical protein